MKKFATALLTSASIMVAASSAHAIIIDDFDSPDGGESNTVSMNGESFMVAVGTADASVGGVTRMLSAEKTGSILQPNDRDFTVDINNMNDGELVANSGSGVSGTFVVSYQTIDGSVFDMDDTDSFSLSILSADQPGSTIALSVDGGMNFGTEVDIAPSFTQVDYEFSFLDLGYTLGDDLDFAFRIIGTEALDIEIDLLETVCVGVGRTCQVTDVSEPASLGLLGLGLIGIGAAARRRKA